LFADGVLPSQLLEMTWRDVHIRLYGIEKRKIEHQRNARNIAYAIHVHNVERQHRLSVFDFMPLSGDPTRQELAEHKAKQDQREAAELRQLYELGMKMFNNAEA
jgi:ABC-type Mn2+/Zn2+ transport system ATPase subunit